MLRYLPLFLLFYSVTALAQSSTPSIDLSGLSEERLALYEELVSSRVSPCEGAETLGVCLSKVDACLTCTARARALARALRRYKEPTAEKLNKFLDNLDATEKTPPATIDLSLAVAKGPENAPVTIVEFADFECSFCGKLEPELQAVYQKHSDKIRLYFFQFPLTQMHPMADSAARAALAAEKQGKFWEMHDLLYARQSTLSEENLKTWATELGLDLQKFDADRNSPEIRKKTSANFDQGMALKISGTPALFINGRPYEDANTRDALEDTILYEYAKKTGDRAAFANDPARASLARERSQYSVWLSLGNFALEVIFLFLVLKTRAAAWLLTRIKTPRPNRQVFLYVLFFTLVSSLLFLPVRLFSSWYFDTWYGLSNQSLGTWLLEQGKSLGISLLVTPAMCVLFYKGVRRFPQRWWLVTAAAVIPIVLLLTFVLPVLIAPLFNDYTPLPEGPVRSAITQLANKENIPLEGIYQMDMSRQTSRANAFVTGIGATKRIVIADTMLKSFSPEEIAFVTGHEIGHYVLQHVLLGVAIAGIGGFLLLWLLAVLVKRLLAHDGERWGIQDLASPASYPALLLLLSIMMFLASPAQNALSRSFETEADRYGLSITQNGKAAASAFEKLSSQNLADPSPPAWVVFWMYSHPPLQERIDSAKTWKPE